MQQTAAYLSARNMVALSALGATGWLSIFNLPYEIDTLHRQWGLSETFSGSVASAELLVMATSVALASRFIARWDKRIVAAWGITLALGSSALSAWAPGLLVLLLSRMAFGGGCGLVIASANAIPAQYPRTERTYAYMQLGLSLTFGATLFAQPVVSRWVHQGAVFLTELGFCALVAGLVLFLPSSRGAHDPLAARQPLNRSVALALLGLATFSLASGAVWAFATAPAAALQIPDARLTTALTAGGLLTIIGPLAAAALGMRAGYLRPLLAAILPSALCAYLLYSADHPLGYLIALCALNPVSSFLSPYAMSLLATQDSTGRAPVLGAAILDYGLGFGPLAAGLIIDHSSAHVLGYLLTLLFLAGAPFYLGATRLYRPALPRAETPAISTIGGF
jgi:predicted MFS family arabinose efflux permease